MLGATVLGGLTSAGGQMSAANTQAQQLQAQQDAANYNADILDKRAGVTGVEGTAASNLQANRAQQYISNQRASQAQSNYFGQSADMILDQSEANAELDRLNMAYQTESNVIGLKQQAAQTRYQGSVAGSQIQPTLNAGYMGAAGSLIGTAGQVAYLGAKQPVNPYLNWSKM